MTEVRSCAWLDCRLLALLVPIDGPAPAAAWQLHAKRGDLSVAIPIRALQCTAAEPDGWWLFSALVPDVLADAHPLGPLTLSDGEREHQLADPIAEAPVALGRAIRDRCEPAACGRAQAFLSRLATSYELGLTPELAATLHELRDALRHPLPQTKIAPGPLCARLEKVTAIDQHTFWLTGWIHEADPRQTSLTAITPEGTRIQPQAGATTYHPRPAYAKALDDPHTTTLGFHTLIQTPNPSIHPHGWILELQATNGRRVQDTARQPTDPDATALWDHIIDTLRATPNDTNTLTHQILPTLEHLRFNQARDASAPIRTPIERLELIETGESGATVQGELWLPGTNRQHDALAQTYSFAVEGRLRAADGQVVTVQATHLGEVLRSVEASIALERLTDHGDDGTGRKGFRLVLGTLALPPEFEVQIDAMTADGPIALGKVQGRRRRLRPGRPPAIQPLMIRTMGRSGSSWLMVLLSRHPEVVAYDPIAYEARLGDYWMRLLRTLSQPVSYIQTVLPQVYGEDWWVGTERPTPPPQRAPEAQMVRWLGNHNPQALAEFCVRQINAFYATLAGGEDRPCKYFAEKARAGATAQLIGELYPDARQLMLVRDFRDMFCSIREFNRRAGLEQWRRAASSSEVEWVHGLRAMVDQMLLGWRGRAQLVRYEDLIADTHVVVAEVCRYVGVDADPSLIDGLVSEARDLISGQVRAEQSTSASDEASVGRWKRELSDELRAACADAFEDLLLEFGYEPTFG